MFIIPFETISNSEKNSKNYLRNTSELFIFYSDSLILLCVVWLCPLTSFSPSLFPSLPFFLPHSHIDMRLCFLEPLERKLHLEIHLMLNT